ncbi:MAG: HIT family protein [Lachnospiraceae bacterium]|nr:HIT family protein [Lachnospiraceae bacterium]
MRDINCIFCKISAGEIPSYTIYEDNKFKAIFDLSPVTRGHAIILPKEHFRNIFELDDEFAKEALFVAKKVATAMKEVLNCDGFNILQNNEEIAGQTVFHFHIHLIPRYINDGVKLSLATGELDKSNAEDVAAAIRERVKL